MLFAENVAKNYGSLDVLTDVSFVVGKGEHVGLVGPNGAGKTTILRVLAGDEEPDGGRAFVTSGQSLGYLRQEAGLDSDRSLLEEMWTAFPAARAAELKFAMGWVG